MMVFLPLPPAQARRLRSGEDLGRRRAHAVTPTLLRALGPDSSEEECDYAALSAAGTAALDGLTDLAQGRRLVVAAEVGPGPVDDLRDDLGAVAVERVTWAQVQALFADEQDAAGLVRAAAAAATGVPLDRALDLPPVVALAESFDLLWYAPAELDVLG